MNQAVVDGAACDAYVVASSSSTHIAVAEEILNMGGASVLIEKPLSPSLAEVRVYG